MIGGDFEGGLTVDLRLLSSVGRAGAKKDAEEVGKALTSDEAKDIYGKIWTSPNTAIGLAYGGAGLLYGLATGQDVGVSIGNNAIQFEGNPLGQDGAALTLGNTINYFGSANPDSGKTFDSNEEYYTYQAKQNYISSNGNYRFTDSDKIILGSHEIQHTYQAQILGPLFLPTYFLSGGISHNNWLEKQADQSGNKAYIKWKQNENK